jgi:hypothetical protein
MARDEHHAVRVFAVGEGDAQRGHACQARGDAVDDCHGNALGLEVFHFFTATAKNKGVTALQTHHGFTGQRFLHHEFFNEGLRGGCAAPAFAHMNEACIGRGVRGDGVADQIVHQEHRGSRNGFDGFERQQFRVARSCADERDVGLRREQGVRHGVRAQWLLKRRVLALSKVRARAIHPEVRPVCNVRWWWHQCRWVALAFG